MQGLHEFIPTERKVAYLSALMEVGFDVLDAGSFVSPKAMPQMADTADVLPPAPGTGLGHRGQLPGRWGRTVSRPARHPWFPFLDLGDVVAVQAGASKMDGAVSTPFGMQRNGRGRPWWPT